MVTHRFLVPLSGVRIPVGLQTILSEGGFCFDTKDILSEWADDSLSCTPADHSVSLDNHFPNTYERYCRYPMV